MIVKLFQLNFFVLILNWNITVEHYRKKIGLSCDIQLVISNSSAINKISRVHAVGTPRIGIAVTVAQATLCDFQLDTILQPHCLAISAKVRKRQVKR